MYGSGGWCGCTRTKWKTSRGPARATSSACSVSTAHKAEFNYTHKKQTGGSGQYGRVAGYVEPMEDGDFEFVDETHGGSIPREFVGSVEKGFRSMMSKGRLIGFPVTGFRVVVNDGAA